MAVAVRLAQASAVAEAQERFAAISLEELVSGHAGDPADVAERTLDVLGVRSLFPRVIGLDEAGHSKPHPAAFDIAYGVLGRDPSQVVAVGDRYAVDLEVPLSRGSGGVLVESMDDVYALPLVLARGLAASKS